MRERLTLRFVSLRYVIMFSSLVPWLKFTYATSMQKQVTAVSLVLKDSDTKSETLSSLIRLSVSDSQNTDSLKVVSFIGK